MGDVAASMALAAANAIVAYLNVAAWHESGEARDAMAVVAWAGSTAYWLIRGLVAMAA